MRVCVRECESVYLSQKRVLHAIGGYNDVIYEEQLLSVYNGAYEYNETNNISRIVSPPSSSPLVLVVVEGSILNNGARDRWACGGWGGLLGGCHRRVNSDPGTRHND